MFVRPLVSQALARDALATGSPFLLQHLAYIDLICHDVLESIREQFVVVAVAAVIASPWRRWPDPSVRTLLYAHAQ